MKYDDENRGKIQDRDKATRVNDFSNLKFGNITPTDIDGFIDFANRCFVFIETKFKGSLMPKGQRLALERLCDATTKAGIKSVVIVAGHESKGDIDVGNSEVTEYRYKGRWAKQFRKISVRDAVEKFKSK